MTAALVSGGAALIVAVLGIGGAIAAQLFTTRHAFENSLALQERQYAKQERERQEQSQREDAYRFAEQRRSTYGRFVLHAVDTEKEVAKNLERIGRQHGGAGRGSRHLEMSAEPAEQLVADARERTRRLHGEFGTACEEIYLLGSQEVRWAADRLWDEAHKAMHSADSGYTSARAAFLEAARQELGIMPNQQYQTLVEESPPDQP
jgi:hypothetical protein